MLSHATALTDNNKLRAFNTLIYINELLVQQLPKTLVPYIKDGVVDIYSVTE